VIHFENSDVWAEFGKKYSSRNDHTVVDLSSCASLEEVIRRLGHTLRGRDSPLLKSGKSPDALIDVMSDWFSENIDKMPI
jgi:hypothetical protein